MPAKLGHPPVHRQATEEEREMGWKAANANYEIVWKKGARVVSASGYPVVGPDGLETVGLMIGLPKPQQFVNEYPEYITHQGRNFPVYLYEAIPCGNL